MSLYEESDGLLSTNVTWQDVEIEMQKSLDTKARFGENKKATNISDMKGFMSRIALIDPDWTNTEKDEVLPKRFCVKISSQLQLTLISKVLNTEETFDDEKLKGLGHVTRECHNREVETYKLLMKFNHPDVPYTKVYALKPFDDENDLKAFIISDFVDNIHSTGMNESFRASDLMSVVKAVATFSGLGYSLTDKELAFCGGPEFMEMAFTEFFDDKSRLAMNKSILKAFGDDFIEQAEKMVKVNEHYANPIILKRYTNIVKELGLAMVLTHGDLWASNMLHTKREDGSLHLEAIIDWQGTGRCSPGLDLSRLLIGCLNTIDRKQYKDEILELYYHSFVDQLNGKPEPFTYQELYNAYHLYLPLMAMLVLPGVIAFKDMSQLEGEEREKMETTCMAKMKGIVEDVLVAHELNLQNYPSFVSL